MAIILGSGLEIENGIYDELTARQRQASDGCRATYNDCSSVCGEISSYTEWGDCMDRCVEAYEACWNNNWQIYERDLRRFARPIGGVNRDPEQARQDMKAVCAIASNVYDGAGKVFILAGAVVAVAMPMAGVMMGIVGGLTDVVAWYLQQIAKDPPADDYQDVFGPRRIEISEIVPPVAYGSSSSYSDFLPLIYPNLETVSLLEATYVALDRATYAREVNAEDPYFMQLRVSQGFAENCALSLQRAAGSHLNPTLLKKRIF